MIEIKDKYQCCGCSSCVQKCPKQCISLVEDNEGFLYPIVNVKACIDCGLCDKVCPLQHDVPIMEPIQVLAAYNTNEEIRMQSSSGGIFTLLAEKTIKEGGVVFGARFNEQWEVILDYTETIEGIAAFRGSKYVQAKVNDTFKQCKDFLQTNRQVLFSGTPCQIAGLKSYLDKDYENLLTVDVVCHGVPSPMIWRRYLQELAEEHITARRAVTGKSTVSSSLNVMSSIKDIKFRDKSDGWKKYRFVLQFAEASAEGKQSSVSSSLSECHRDNLFMQAFLSDLILRPSCYECRFRGTNKRQADISIADFWGVNELIPTMDDDKGISLTSLNTEKGKNSLPISIIHFAADFYSAKRWNGGLQDSIENNPRRQHFFSILKKKNLQDQMTTHVLPECQYENKITPTYWKLLRRLKGILRSFINR